MKALYDIEEYLYEIKIVSKSIEKDFLKGKSILISGASGLIGSYLIDVLLIDPSLDVTIYALTLSLEHGQKRFSKFANDPRLKFIVGNVVEPMEVPEPIDYVIHGASYTDPKGYAEHPIDTMLVNFLGVKSMLDVAVKKHAKKFMFMSSCEIYGEADLDEIPEDYTGHLDTMDVRSCYNESKRASETLCVCYAKEKGLDVVIPRFSRCFGPTMKLTDTKALSQFLFNGLKHNDIVLKSEGTQKYSYLYVADAVRSILFLLQHGENMQAYNVASPEVLFLKDMANSVASICRTRVVFDLSKDKGMSYSKTSRAIQSTKKIEALGFKTTFAIEDGLKQTIAILKKTL